MRKAACLWMVALTCSTAVASLAKPLDERESYHWDIPSAVQQTVVPPREANFFDDYVLALGKSAHRNFLVDAADFPADERVQPFPATAEVIQGRWEPRLSSVLVDLASAHEVARLAYDQSTYLLWRRPELLHSARLVVASEQYQKPQTVQNPTALFRSVYALLKQKNPAEDGTGIRAGLAELPPSVQADFVAAARYAKREPSFHRDRLLEDAFWNTVQVRQGSRAQGRNAGDADTVFFGGTDEEGHKLPFFTLFYGSIDYEGQKLFPYDSVIPVPAEAKEAAVEQPLPADALTVPPLSSGYPKTFEGLSWEQLTQEAALAHPITGDWKRRPLAQVLSEVGKQCGVKLVLDKGVTPSRLVTAHLEALPAATLLGALARLELLQWDKTGATTFVLKARDLTELQTTLLRSGDSSYWRKDGVDESTKERKARVADLQQEVVEQLEAAQVPRLQSLPFTKLSPSLQHRIKGEAQFLAASGIMQYMATYALIQPDSETVLRRFGEVDGSLLVDASCVLSNSTLVVGKIFYLRLPLPAPQQQKADATQPPQRP